MAHFAEIDNNGKVLRVVVVGNADIVDQTGNENEQVGIAYCQKLFGGQWIQTSYNGLFRNCFAGIGFKYDELNDVFIPTSPYPSWILNATTHNWEAPTPKPDDGRRYMWDESLVAWRDITDKLIEQGLL